LEHAEVEMQTPGVPFALHGPFNAAYVVARRAKKMLADRKFVVNKCIGSEEV